MQQLEPLLVYLRTRKRIAFWFGLFAVGFGAVVPFIPAEDSGGWAMYAIMSFMILFGSYWIILGMIPVEKLRGISVLRDSPGEIVWFYLIQGEQVSTLCVYLRNRKVYRFVVEYGGETQVMEHLAASAPHAQQGFDEEFERLFKEDPLLLLKKMASLFFLDTCLKFNIR